ncbi:MAG: AAA family ATPase [Rhizomicrobium sp.]
MALSAVSIEGYRSVRRLTLPLSGLSVFVGGNGVGKTNLYRALGLLQAAAQGGITRAIAQEGGVGSVLWAGPRSKGKPVRLALRAHFDVFEYGIEIGLPGPSEAAFALEPRIKEERLVLRGGRRDVVMMERRNAAVTLRNAEGARETLTDAVLPSESALAAFRDAVRYPELEIVRRELLDWRLYHDFRTDADSPLRRPCHAITTPTLSADGRDLAAVLATLFVIRGDTVDLRRAVDDAFPGARLAASDHGTSCCDLGMEFADMPRRTYRARELSDGTLKYLCLLGALMGYRLPGLIALNEPEASLHPALLGPLARLIAHAAERTRVWIVTHSQGLADALEAEAGAKPRRVVKIDGATKIEGLKLSGEFADDEE